VRYAIDLRARRVAFELKASSARPGTFQGNFQALLNKESRYPYTATIRTV
jgi:hypothetical protein